MASSSLQSSQWPWTHDIRYLYFRNAKMIGRCHHTSFMQCWQSTIDLCAVTLQRSYTRHLVYWFSTFVSGSFMGWQESLSLILSSIKKKGTEGYISQKKIAIEYYHPPIITSSVIMRLPTSSSRSQWEVQPCPLIWACGPFFFTATALVLLQILKKFCAQIRYQTEVLTVRCLKAKICDSRVRTKNPVCPRTSILINEGIPISDLMEWGAQSLWAENKGRVRNGKDV